MTHTLGPWKLGPLRKDIVNGGEYRHIAKPKWIADVRASTDEEEANARLIAAAPDLLERSRQVVDFILARVIALGGDERLSTDAEEAIAPLRAAIARATTPVAE